MAIFQKIRIKVFLRRPEQDYGGSPGRGETLESTTV